MTANSLFSLFKCPRTTWSVFLCVFGHCIYIPVSVLSLNYRGLRHHRGLNLQPVQQTPGVTETGTIQQRIPHTHAGQQVPVAETADGCVCVLGRWFCCVCVCGGTGMAQGFLPDCSQSRLSPDTQVHAIRESAGGPGTAIHPKHEHLNEAAALTSCKPHTQLIFDNTLPMTPEQMQSSGKNVKRMVKEEFPKLNVFIYLHS